MPIPLKEWLQLDEEDKKHIVLLEKQLQAQKFIAAKKILEGFDIELLVKICENSKIIATFCHQNAYEYLWLKHLTAFNNPQTHFSMQVYAPFSAHQMAYGAYYHWLSVDARNNAPEYELEYLQKSSEFGYYHALTALVGIYLNKLKALKGTLNAAKFFCTDEQGAMLANINTITSALTLHGTPGYLQQYYIYMNLAGFFQPDKTYFEKALEALLNAKNHYDHDVSQKAINNAYHGKGIVKGDPNLRTYYGKGLIKEDTMPSEVWNIAIHNLFNLANFNPQEITVICKKYAVFTVSPEPTMSPKKS